MSPPTTLEKVRAALKRLMPPTDGWQSDASMLGLERNSIGLALAMANDIVESIFGESFPDTSSAFIARWERVCRVPSRPTDDIAIRRERILAVLQRVNGPQDSRLLAMLVNLLNCALSDIRLLEQLRANVEAGITVTTGTVSDALPTVAPGLQLTFGTPWPGNVDDTGVRVYLALSALGATSAMLVSPDGTSWTFAPTSTAGWYSNRTSFLGKPASNAMTGPWSLWIYDPSGVATLTEFRLLVSNTIDSAQIYYFYAVRDAGLGGAPDVAEAQRQFTRYALGHMYSIVAEHTAAICDESHSLADREPVGVA